MPKRKKRCLEAEDLYRLKLVTGCEISPDGSHVVYCVHQVNRKTEKKSSNLWIVPTQGGRARQYTFGEHTDIQPRWSPDGGWIAFISNRENEKRHQIYVIPFEGGGEARPISAFDGHVGGFSWSPEGDRLICSYRKASDEAAEQARDKRRNPQGIVSRRVTRMFFKADGGGFIPRERWHLWTVDARTGRTVQLTSGDLHDELDPCWSPDGRSIAFCSSSSADPDLDPDNIDLYVAPAAGGRSRKIEASFGPKEKPQFSPDGKWIAYLGQDGEMRFWKQTHLWVVSTNGKGEARNLTKAFDVDVSPWTYSDMGVDHLPMAPPVWSKSGHAIYVQVSRYGNTGLKSVAIDGKARSLDAVVDDAGAVGLFGFDREQTKLAYFRIQSDHPGEVYVRDMTSGRSRQLTYTNARILNSIDLGEAEETWLENSDGTRVQGWILKPPGFDPSRKYPSILCIHGGPQVQHGNVFMFEFHYWAARGYVVHYCNPRGSQGYGEAHTKAVWDNWGTVDYDDLMAWTDILSRKRYIDGKRMGVTGCSYGGFMTNWIIGHTSRFGAAVSQGSVSNLVSLYGSSDINWLFEREFGDKTPWGDIDHYWRMSPLKYAADFRTPTLIIHPEQDLRCPVEQAEQLFVALKRLGVESEMILVPDESHALLRTGRTDRRVERLRSICEWFDRQLKRGKTSMKR